MVEAKLDVSAWNLALAVGVVLPGCSGTEVDGANGAGDAIGTDGTTGDADGTGAMPMTAGTDASESDGVDDDDDDDDDGSGPSPDLPEGPECETDRDCPPSDWCNPETMQCEEYCYGICERYECLDDTDCPLGEYCAPIDSYYGPEGNCAPLSPLEECSGALSLVPLPIGLDSDGLHSLAFVDANGDAAEDLLISRDAGTELVLGPGEDAAIAVPVPEAVESAASGDFTGDGVPDFVVALASTDIAVLSGDGTGAYSLLTADVSPGIDATKVDVIDFNGDDAMDIVATNADDVHVIFGDSAGGVTQTLELVAGAVLGSSVTAPPTIFVSLTGRVERWHGGSDADAQADAVHFENTNVVEWLPLAAGSGSDPVLLGTAPMAEGTLLRVGTKEEAFVLERPVALGAVGELGLDGIEDFVLLGPAGELTQIAATVSGYPDCTRAFDLPVTTVEHFALGDLDGDGRSEVVIAEPSAVTVFAAE